MDINADSRTNMDCAYDFQNQMESVMLLTAVPSNLFHKNVSVIILQHAGMIILIIRQSFQDYS